MHQVLVIHPFGRKMLSFLPVKTAGRAGAGGGAGVSRRPTGLRQLVAAVELLDIAVYIWVAHIRCLALALRGECEVWLVSDRSFDDLLVKHWRLQTLSPRALAAALAAGARSPENHMVAHGALGCYAARWGL